MRPVILNWNSFVIAAAALLAAGCQTPQSAERVNVPINVVFGSNAAVDAVDATPCTENSLPEYMRFRFVDVAGEALLESGAELTPALLNDTPGFLSDLPVGGGDRRADRTLVYLNPFTNLLPYEGDPDVLGAPLDTNGGAGPLSGIYLLPKTTLRIEFTAWARPWDAQAEAYSTTPELCTGETTVTVGGDGTVVTVVATQGDTVDLPVQVTDQYNTGFNYTYGGTMIDWAHVSLVDQETGYAFPPVNNSDDGPNGDFTGSWDFASNLPPLNSTYTFRSVPTGREYKFIAWYPGRHPIGWNGNFGFNVGFQSNIDQAGKYGVSAACTVGTDCPNPITADINFNNQVQPSLQLNFPIFLTATDKSIPVPSGAPKDAPDNVGVLDYLRDISICHLANGNYGFAGNWDADCVTDAPVVTAATDSPLPRAPEMAFISSSYAYDYNGGFLGVPNANFATSMKSYRDFQFAVTEGNAAVPVPDPDRVDGRSADAGIIQPEFGVGLGDSYCLWAEFFGSPVALKNARDSRFESAKPDANKLTLKKLNGSFYENGVCQTGPRTPRPDLDEGVQMQVQRAGAPSTLATTVALSLTNLVDFTVPNGTGSVVAIKAPAAGDRPDLDNDYITSCSYLGTSLTCDLTDLCYPELVSLDGGDKIRVYNVADGFIPSTGYVELTVTGSWLTDCGG